jgi:putative membrane protein
MKLSLWMVVGLVALMGLSLLAAVEPAYAHEGLNRGQNPLTAWNANPTTTLLLLAVAYLYVTGLQRWHNPSYHIGFWQKLSFFLGLFAIFLALQSPIDPLADHLFSIHQVQHILLRMIAPILILLGLPLTPILRGLPPWMLQGVVRPVVRSANVRSVYSVLTRPALVVLLFMGSLFFWQIPVLHNLALRNGEVHEVMHFSMLVTGLRFWWLFIDPRPGRVRLHYGLRVLILGLIVLPNTLLGALITFSRGLLYDAYAEVEQPFNLSLMMDQQLGGLVLWLPGDMMSIIAAGIVMLMWYQHERARDQADAALYEGGKRTYGAVEPAAGQYPPEALQ